MNESEKMVQMPIDRLHYSAMTQLLRNPLIFKLKYILGIYDGMIGMAGMIGRAGHTALKAYYGGDPDHPLSAIGDKIEERAQAIDLGLAYIDEFSDSYVNYGKTGSKEQVLNGYAKAMQFYFAEEPEYNEIIMCEEKMEAVIKTVDGQELPLPAVGIPDLVHKRKDGGVEIIDTKFVKAFTRYENDDGTSHEDYIKIVQSQFLWHLLRASKNISADRMVFREIKYSENMKENAGKPQVRDYVIPFAHEQYRTIFYNLYRDVVMFIANPNAVYLPNLADQIDGEQAGLLYAQGLLNADMSDVEVMHKVKDVALVSKKFVPSRLERVENRDLPPEERIKLRLAEFGIPIEPVETKDGANVVQYRFKVSAGVRMTTFKKHEADIARAIEAKGPIRILAPIPGTSLVGIEVEKETRAMAILDKKHFKKGTLEVALGTTVSGEVYYMKLNEAPHLLVAGATGSGKSILIKSIITSLINQLPASKLQLILIDPKRVELRAFAKAAQLQGKKVIYEYEDSVKELTKLVDTMEERYKRLEATDVRDIAEYNRISGGVTGKMKYIVVVIDEFADLIMRSRMKKRKKDEDADANVELLIVRLAQMARAVGIHLILATQRPSVDVITGLIKANFPARIALTTASETDSKVILGDPGAEKLSGKGDMLYQHPGGGRTRIQGFMIN